MSTLEAALIVVAVLIVSLAGTYELVDRARHRESTRDRLIREAHQRAEEARDWDDIALAWELPAFDPARERLKKRTASDPRYADMFRRIADDHEQAPDLADFADRLLKEIRDEQHKGEL